MGIWGIVLVLGVGIIIFLLTKEASPAPLAATTIVPTPTNSPTPKLPTPAPSETPSATVAAPTLRPTASPSPTLQPPTQTPIPATPSPESTRLIVIGYSVAGRPLEVYQFGTGSTERLIVAGIHGGYEWNTIALADELIEYLEQHPEKVPAGVKLYILRSLNPDGEARSQGYDGRANENGVDINRNFPADWQLNWNRNGCWDYRPITAGERPASEPETVAVMSFIQAHDIDALISYHSAALGIFPGGKPPTPASIQLAEAIAAASDYAYPPINTGCEYTGQLTDWAAQVGVAAVDVELTNHTDTDFEQNLKILAMFLRR